MKLAEHIKLQMRHNESLMTTSLFSDCRWMRHMIRHKIYVCHHIFLLVQCARAHYPPAIIYNTTKGNQTRIVQEVPLGFIDAELLVTFN